MAKFTPFDAVAQSYDQEFTHTETGNLQRQAVYRLLQPLLAPIPDQGRILELNCGTGEDAIWLARAGYDVLATDISPEMVKVAQTKREQLSQISGKISYRELDANDLSSLFDGEKFDLIFSNFGGLNCLSPEQLTKFATESQRVLRPNGLMIAVVMSSFCWWESLYFLAKRSWKQAWRRRKKGPISASLDQQTTINTWYYSPATLSRLLSSSFIQKYTAPIGFWLPPSYLDPLFKSKPGILAGLNQLEKRSSQFSWLARGADHYLVVFNNSSR